MRLKSLTDPPSAPKIYGEPGRHLVADQPVNISCVTKGGNPPPEVGIGIVDDRKLLVFNRAGHFRYFLIFQ